MEIWGFPPTAALRGTVDFLVLTVKWKQPIIASGFHVVFISNTAFTDILKMLNISYKGETTAFTVSQTFREEEAAKIDSLGGNFGKLFKHKSFQVNGFEGQFDPPLYITHIPNIYIPASLAHRLNALVEMMAKKNYFLQTS